MALQLVSDLGYSLHATPSLSVINHPNLSLTVPLTHVSEAPLVQPAPPCIYSVTNISHGPAGRPPVSGGAVVNRMGNRVPCPRGAYIPVREAGNRRINKHIQIMTDKTHREIRRGAGAVCRTLVHGGPGGSL